MKLVTFVHQGQTRLGALPDILNGGGARPGAGALWARLIDLNRADPQIPADILAFLAGGAGSHRLAQRALGAPLGADAVGRAQIERGGRFRERGNCRDWRVGTSGGRGVASRAQGHQKGLDA